MSWESVSFEFLPEEVSVLRLSPREASMVGKAIAAKHLTGEMPDEFAVQFPVSRLVTIQKLTALDTTFRESKSRAML